MPPPTDEDRISLTAAIAGLRSQLHAAAQAAPTGESDIKLRVIGIELELSVVAEDTASADGEVGWWIFKARAGLSAKDAVTQKIKLTLNAGDLDVASPNRGA